MNASEQRSAFEAKLAAAHRMAYYAAQRAQELGYKGAEQELIRVQFTLSDLMQKSLSSKPADLKSLRSWSDDVLF